MGAARRLTTQAMTDGQRRAIFASARDLGLDVDGLRDLVEAETRQRHISALSAGQASAILERLLGPSEASTRGPCGKQRFTELDGRPGMATGPQLRKLHAMWNERSYADDKEAALRTWLRNRWHVSDLRFLDRRRASQIIAALESFDEEG